VTRHALAPPTARPPTRAVTARAAPPRIQPLRDAAPDTSLAACAPLLGAPRDPPVAVAGRASSDGPADMLRHTRAAARPRARPPRTFGDTPRIARAHIPSPSRSVAHRPRARRHEDPAPVTRRARPSSNATLVRRVGSPARCACSTCRAPPATSPCQATRTSPRSTNPGPDPRPPPSQPGSSLVSRPWVQ